MARALSNPALYNPTNPYAPPGVDFSYFATDAADALRERRSCSRTSTIASSTPTAASR